MCDAVGGPAAIFIKDDFYGVPFEHLDLVEFHLAGEVGEDFFAVCEDDAVFQVRWTSVTWPRVVGWFIGLSHDLTMLLCW